MYVHMHSTTMWMYVHMHWTSMWMYVHRHWTSMWNAWMGSHIERMYVNVCTMYVDVSTHTFNVWPNEQVKPINGEPFFLSNPAALPEPTKRSAYIYMQMKRIYTSIQKESAAWRGERESERRPVFLPDTGALEGATKRSISIYMRPNGLYLYTCVIWI